VTEDELQELVGDCPVLYHMAQRNSWQSIQRHGLLSTTALLDLFEIEGQERVAIEQTRRPAGVYVEHPQLGQAVVRDQIPMDDNGLRRCLRDNLTPADWYLMLNERVFFWLTRARLLKLLNAGAYAREAHDVLEIDTVSLIAAHRDHITLCPMNSGCTKPFPHPRGLDTFTSIDQYPYQDWKRKRRRGERVVELSVMGGVPDIVQHVRRVVVMQRDETLELIYERNNAAAPA